MKQIIKSAFIIGVVLFLSACGNNYSGNYIAFLAEKSFGEYNVYSLELNMEHKKDDIEGNLIISSDNEVYDYIIKTANFDDDENLHLKLALKGMEFLSTLNMVQFAGDNNNLKFKTNMSDITGINKNEKQVIEFKKYNKKDTLKRRETFKKELLNKEEKDLKKFLSDKNYTKAKTAVHFINKLGYDLSPELEKKFKETKNYYEVERPKLMKEAYERAVDYYNNNIASKSIKEDPTSDIDTAIGLFENALSYEPGYTTKTSINRTIGELKALKKIKVAYDLVDEEKYDEAIKIAEEADKLTPYGYSSYKRQFESFKNMNLYRDKIAIKYKIGKKIYEQADFYPVHIFVKNNTEKYISSMDIEAQYFNTATNKKWDDTISLYYISAGEEKEVSKHFKFVEVPKANFDVNFMLSDLRLE